MNQASWRFSAGGLDWAALWALMGDAVDEARPILPPTGAGDRWGSRAHAFDKRSRARRVGDALAPALAAELRPDDVVMDVGAGTGRHAVLLAGACARVVAVEPSRAMRARLVRRVADEGLTNVALVAEPWPSATPVTADVVFSSHVLYGVPDVVGFLAAMHRAAGRLAALILGVRAPADALAPLFHRVHGWELPQRPAALEAFNLLHQLGARPGWSLVPASESAFAFTSGDADVIELCHRLSLAPDAAGMGRVREALAVVAPAGPDGRHVLGTTGPNALITWDTTTALGARS